jgi:hypothetical protein
MGVIACMAIWRRSVPRIQRFSASLTTEIVKAVQKAIFYDRQVSKTLPTTAFDFLILDHNEFTHPSKLFLKRQTF